MKYLKNALFDLTEYIFEFLYDAIEFVFRLACYVVLTWLLTFIAAALITWMLGIGMALETVTLIWVVLFVVFAPIWIM